MKKNKISNDKSCFIKQKEKNAPIQARPPHEISSATCQEKRVTLNFQLPINGAKKKERRKANGRGSWEQKNLVKKSWRDFQMLHPKRPRP